MTLFYTYQINCNVFVDNNIVGEAHTSPVLHIIVLGLSLQNILLYQ